MILIKNIHIFAPEDMGIGDILIEGSNFAAIGRTALCPDDENRLQELASEYDITILDGTGKAAFPGLIDAHVHILGGGGEGGYKTRTPEVMLSDIISGGVTTIVGCLGTDGTTRCMSSLLAKARGLEEEGISTYIYTGSYQVPVRTLTGSVMDDVILIDKCIGCGEIAISDHRSSQPTREEFCRIVADTRTGGILSGKAGLVNIHMGDGKRMLEFLRYVIEETEIPPYNMLPTHINRSLALFADGVDYAKRLGGYIDMTTSFDKDHMEEDELKAAQALKLAIEQGVPENHVTFSSDGQGSLPIFDAEGHFAGLGVGKVSSLYDEFRDAVLVEGLSVSTALRAVTSNPAMLLKLGQKGCLRSGADADLVLADEASLTIDSVIAGGRFLMKEGQLLARGTFETQ